MHASVTLRAIGPAWSKVMPSGTTPAVLTSPNVGFNPTIPHSADGMRIEPPVSVPTEAKPMPLPTATADPPLDPPETRSGAHGLRELP
jgi:hypothetical protein